MGEKIGYNELVLGEGILSCSYILIVLCLRHYLVSIIRRMMNNLIIGSYDFEILP